MLRCLRSRWRRGRLGCGAVGEGGEGERYCPERAEDGVGCCVALNGGGFVRTRFERFDFRLRTRNAGEKWFYFVGNQTIKHIRSNLMNVTVA